MTRIITFLLTAVVSLSAYAVAPVEPQELATLEPLEVHASTTQNIVDALASRHYVPTVLDDDLSSRIFDTYLSDLDPSKSYFLKQDIEEFEIYPLRDGQRPASR